MNLNFMIDEEMIRDDMKRLRLIIDYIRLNPQLDQFMNSIISIHPWKDIASSIWIFSIIGIVFIGFEHFFVVILNLAIVMTLRNILQSKQPVEYDKHLKPRTDAYETSYGLPSLESHMGVVILFHLSYHYNHLWFYIISCLLLLLIGFSRIYSRCRFPYQILCSLGSGMIGLISICILAHIIQLVRLSNHQKGEMVAFSMLIYFIHFALSIESNDSRLTGIKRQEYISVLRGIMSTPESSAYAFTNPSSSSSSFQQNSNRIINSKSNSLQSSSSSSSSSRIEEKHDSLYFLQKTMERRQSAVSVSENKKNNYSSSSSSNLRK